jgi:hypothetical protein
MGDGMNDLPKSWMIGAGIGAVVLLALWVIARRTGNALASGLDVTSSDNWIASAVDKAGEAVTGKQDFSLGVAAWEWFSTPEEQKALKAGSGPQYAYGSAKKKAAAPAVKQGPTQGGSWSVTPSADDRAPSVLNPGQGGTGPSFEQQSKGVY